MAKLIGKQELYRTDLKNFKSEQGIGGKSLVDRYNMAENVIINRNISEKYRHFLAQPIKEEEGFITWFGKEGNETPRTLSELQGDELQKYSQILYETKSHYENAIDLLRQSGKAEEKINAEYLTDAIKFIYKKYVYCYDDIVVLGVWGMESIIPMPESDGIFTSNVINPSKKKVEQETNVKKEPEHEKEEIPTIIPAVPLTEPEIDKQKVEIENYEVLFNAGENGNMNGKSYFTKQRNGIISNEEIPKIDPKKRYEFTGWDKNPINFKVSDNVTFTAQYKKIPWYRRFWLWLIGAGCLKWLLFALLMLLLFLLFCWLFRRCGCGCDCGCNEKTISVVPPMYEQKKWVDEDKFVDTIGMFNPGDPYTLKKTNPGEFRDELGDNYPEYNGVLSPIDTAQILRRPNQPTIVGDKLNIVLKDKNKELAEFARAFKEKYPDSKYKIDYVREKSHRMQIIVPPEERERMKKELRGEFAPEYDIFVFDDRVMLPSYIPSDPAFSDASNSWYLQVVNAPLAWDETLGSKDITIAIVDNGFNLNHPELKSKIILPYNIWLNSDKIFQQSKDHGTHVAGTALAAANNGEGLCGIAPNCRFMPVQVGDKNGIMTLTSVLDGILYALYQGADVINVSLGTDFSSLSEFSGLPEGYMESVIEEQEIVWNEISEIADHHKATIIIAAGNDNTWAGIDPLRRPKNIITVSAVDKQNSPYQKANFSNYGSDISAPGVDIYSCVGNRDYEKKEGTSMAAPIVSGAVALMKSLNKDLTNPEIRCILQKTGVPTSGNIGNLVQIDKAVTAVKEGKNCNDFDTIFPCNKAVEEGGDDGFLGSFQMGKKSGSFLFKYDTQNVPDTITIYDGPNTNGKVIFTYGGSSVNPKETIIKFNQSIITIKIKTLDPTRETYWNFIVNCPE